MLLQVFPVFLFLQVFLFFQQISMIYVQVFDIASS